MQTLPHFGVNWKVKSYLINSYLRRLKRLYLTEEEIIEIYYEIQKIINKNEN